MDTNDRFLRKITIGQSPTERGKSREVSFFWALEFIEVILEDKRLNSGVIIHVDVYVVFSVSLTSQLPVKSWPFSPWQPVWEICGQNLETWWLVQARLDFQLLLMIWLVFYYVILWYQITHLTELLENIVIFVSTPFFCLFPSSTYYFETAYVFFIFS